MFLRKPDDLDGVISCLVRRAALIGLAKAVAGGNHRAEFVDLRLKRTKGATLVQHEADIGNIPRIARWQRGADGFGIGHLGHTARMDKARDLDAPHAAHKRARYQLDLVDRRKNARLVLQAIACGDFDHFDVLGHEG